MCPDSSFFGILNEIQIPEKEAVYIESQHYKENRCNRETLISEVIREGNVVDSFVVDRGHKDGPEIHFITDTGIIVIHNQISGKMVTKLIARPGQIRRYYLAEGREVPEDIVRIAKEHFKKGYNRI